MDTLRELRLYHWRMVLRYSERRGEFEILQDRAYSMHRRESYRVGALLYRQKHAFHMRAVQALDDYVTGTAEQDDADNPLLTYSGIGVIV